MRASPVCRPAQARPLDLLRRKALMGTGVDSAPAFCSRTTGLWPIEYTHLLSVGDDAITPMTEQLRGRAAPLKNGRARGRPPAHATFCATGSTDPAAGSDSMSSKNSNGRSIISRQVFDNTLAW